MIPRLSACKASSLTISSIVPFGDCGERRIKSRETPVVPHGTSDSIASTWLCGSIASTSRQSESAGSPRRPSAIEKPRSVSVSRQESARVMVCAISSSAMSRAVGLAQPQPRVDGLRPCSVVAYRVAAG
ncbi:Uncharacterised protein [Mycobacterium tuberculosis]|nr:Uncharacterised protein [Mycobacterium tuberculosis]